MDNNKDWSVTSITTMKEKIIQNEKNIREQEYAIQSIVFTRMYVRRMNKKVWKCFNYIEILAKHSITFHTVDRFVCKKNWTLCKKWASSIYQLKIKIFCIYNTMRLF